jgi:DNA integrity scanning protein DisA with diadenylate cyclase activity
MADPERVTRDLLRHAVAMAESVDARAILVYADVFQNRAALRRFARKGSKIPVVCVTRTVDASPEEDRGDLTRIRVPDVYLSRMGQIKIALLIGLTRGTFQRGDTVVCLTGKADSGMLDTIVVMEVEEEFEMVASTEAERLGAAVLPEVFTRVLDIAIALGNEGREGRPIGTAFILGDTDKVLTYVRQMILNPFRGYDESERNILNAALTETVKEFAALDGAFIIRCDGVIESAGAYLSPGLRGAALPFGLGARHNSAAGITGVTDATAIVVSESTGNVSILREGKIVTEIERPRPVGAPRRADADSEG